MSGRALNMTGNGRNSAVKWAALAKNLRLMGVEATADESLEGLIAKVLEPEVDAA